jgi:hypothetical protein
VRLGRRLSRQRARVLAEADRGGRTGGRREVAAANPARDYAASTAGRSERCPKPAENR